MHSFFPLRKESGFDRHTLNLPTLFQCFFLFFFSRSLGKEKKAFGNNYTILFCWFFITLKVNRSVYIAKSRQRYYKTRNNILLHVPNHALKDVYMLNYGTIKNANSSYNVLGITQAFLLLIFLSYISSKNTHLVFWTFFRICPAIFE